MRTRTSLLIRPSSPIPITFRRTPSSSDARVTSEWAPAFLSLISRSSSRGHAQHPAVVVTHGVPHAFLNDVLVFQQMPHRAQRLMSHVTTEVDSAAIHSYFPLPRWFCSQRATQGRE